MINSGIICSWLLSVWQCYFINIIVDLNPKVQLILFLPQPLMHLHFLESRYLSWQLPPPPNLHIGKITCAWPPGTWDMSHVSRGCWISLTTLLCPVRWGADCETLGGHCQFPFPRDTWELKPCKESSAGKVMLNLKVSFSWKSAATVSVVKLRFIV